MQKKQLIECVPNFSEGQDMNIITQITDEIEKIEGVKLLDVDPGKATNRTVVTFVGEPEPVINAAFLAIKKASEIIDMSKHSGEHPRMGATDVCPLVPIANISMEETVKWAHKLGEMAGRELDIPFYMYEYASTKPEWTNLATIRSGEYEALADKLTKPEWKPDYGPSRFNPQAGATAIGARDFLIAYNVNLNTTSTRRANSVAFDVREAGRVKRKGDPITGEIVKDENDNPVREPGACKSVKGIGWFIEEYGVAQISMNLTNINDTPLHIAFEEVCKSADKRGLRVTGSELVGLVPLKVMLDAGHYFLKKQQRSTGVAEEEVIKIAVKSFGLDELTPFDPQKKIIEYQLAADEPTPLIEMNLRDFANETASESPAPGGGSISAYVGSLGISLATMVANLSSHKRGWDDRWEEFSDWAARGQQIKDALLKMVDEDTNAFNAIISAFRLSKGTQEEKTARSKAIQAATKYAIEVPFRIMELSLASFEVTKAMAEMGNPNSVTDAGVGGLCARAAVHGAFMNVKINSADLKDKDYVAKVMKAASEMIEKADQFEAEIREIVDKRIDG
ncbi:glutamate formimidoyltransferase [Saprospiraceae bacterium]|jgi:glutamate formiminotransferase/formiminotetrahydrofolate cyclodeaminase|nr:glutamate formimidoyltransferase [Bacteroidota bacterium]MDB4728177.1 glutamate formimidoyltransferase [Saprospiraceae bacterium]MDF1863375.1 glutamate formimidoyltransferase [Saprospiraceae bacterium]